MKVLILEGSLRYDKESSTTYVLSTMVAQEFKKHNAEVKLIHLANYDLSLGYEFQPKKKDNSSDFFTSIADADIIIMATPTWWGHHSSLVQKAIERMTAFDDYAIAHKINVLYNKTFGCLITGDIDGFQHITADLLCFATELGMCIPPQASVVFRALKEGDHDINQVKQDKVMIDTIKQFCATQVTFSKAITKVNLGGISQQSTNQKA